MLPRRLAALNLLGLVGALAACEAPPPEAPVPPPVPAYRPPALSAKQVADLSARCAKVTQAQFRRDWNDGLVSTAGGKTTAAFASHYNVNANTCFYLLSLERVAGAGDASPPMHRKLLFDFDHGVPYGEFLGPADGESPKDRLPVHCRVDAYFCSSESEWQVLVRPFMEE